MTMISRLNAALKDLQIQDRDAATVELAKTYAREIDSGNADLSKLGPSLLNCLEALGMSPRSRNALKNGGTANGPAANPVDELRERRRKRNA